MFVVLTKSQKPGFSPKNSKSGHGTAVSLQLIWRRETALPSPLYHSGAAGIDISPRNIQTPYT